MEDKNSTLNPDETNNTPSEPQDESTTSTQPPGQSQESDTQAQQSTTQGPTSTSPAVDEQHSQQAPTYSAEQYPPLPPPEQYPAPPPPQPQLYPHPPPPYAAASQGYGYQPQPIPYPQADTNQQVSQPQVPKAENTIIIQEQPVATTAVPTTVGDNFLTLSIVMTFLCCLSCSWLSMICTITAIFFALAAQEAEVAGDFDGARNSSGVALACNIIAMTWWIVAVMIILITVPLITLNKCVQSGYYHYGYYYYCYY